MGYTELSGNDYVTNPGFFHLLVKNLNKLNTTSSYYSASATTDSVLDDTATDWNTFVTEKIGLTKLKGDLLTDKF